MSYDYASAKKMADEIVATLSPFCRQCEIAGSVRRKKPGEIKDIEIVLVPDGQKLHELREVINSKWGKPIIGQFPSRYCRIRGLVNIDIFTCTIDTFGLNLWIRTGPADYVARGLAHWKKITGGGFSHEARLHLKDGTRVTTQTEQQVFNALKCPFLPPEKRR